ncbi:hypothetical protein Q1Z72_01405 [Pseudomonas qingdaonensis]|uniref:hypothetical protein n=1 Tax=Pseudomonas TaxID=286 RepID=UPI002117AA4D|nr:MULTISPECIES: hypothetical protein [Pseudomonas]UXH55945.1 hypothetical protein N5876_32885 [Pseudomonas aeruginosa]UXH68989.1 hypothetical protein N5879_32325 [Pseudomonas aeruginosa]WKL67351.1 hypothetical protein Q1Z72_01405 [Pseudomonas qingdaonensis]
MHLSDKYLATKAKLSAHLAMLGWDTTDLGPIALGTKTFQTAVGEKTAIGYLAPYGEEAAHFQGSYESEGRNVLEAMRAGWKPLTFSEADDELEALAKAFAAEVDAEVSKTYAMRLAAASEAKA